MPYPAQINHEMIIERARDLIETGGPDALTLKAIAGSLGVEPPSLYRHVKNKDALLRAVNEQTWQRLVEALGRSVATNTDPTVRLLRLAHAYREFALTNPHTYALASANTHPDRQPDPHLLERMVLPVQAVVADVLGEPVSLAALRGLWALLHGFVMLEMSGQYRRGGDLDAVFEESVRAMLAGWGRQTA